VQRYLFRGGTGGGPPAAGGIGEQLAIGLARRGSHLALLDRDGERLDAVAASLRAQHPGLSVRTHLVDLADREATERAAAAVLADHDRITLLVNNAGVALSGRLDQVTFEELWWVVEVNLRATAQLTHALLPALLAAPGSHVVNISSLFGLIAPPGQAAYCASKFGVRGFTEALRAEVVPRGVGVTSVHPGGVRTGIGRNIRVGSGVSEAERARSQEVSERLLTMPPERAARIILDAVERRRPRVVISAAAKALDVVARVLPGSYTSLTRAATAVAGRGLAGPPQHT
jgi:short-subunit dehydrogenase